MFVGLLFCLVGLLLDGVCLCVGCLRLLACWVAWLITAGWVFSFWFCCIDLKCEFVTLFVCWLCFLLGMIWCLVIVDCRDCIDWSELILLFNSVAYLVVLYFVSWFWLLFCLFDCFEVVGNVALFD